MASILLAATTGNVDGRIILTNVLVIPYRWDQCENVSCTDKASRTCCALVIIIPGSSLLLAFLCTGFQFYRYTYGSGSGSVRNAWVETWFRVFLPNRGSCFFSSAICARTMIFQHTRSRPTPLSSLPGNPRDTWVGFIITSSPSLITCS